jgi:hypothetical protein
MVFVLRFMNENMAYFVEKEYGLGGIYGMAFFKHFPFRTSINSQKETKRLAMSCKLR